MMSMCKNDDCSDGDDKICKSGTRLETHNLGHNLDQRTPCLWLLNVLSYIDFSEVCSLTWIQEENK